MNEGLIQESYALQLGPLTLSESVLNTWLIMALLVGLSVWLMRRIQTPGTALQTLLETVYTSMENAVKEVAPSVYAQLTPLIASLWIFLVVANLLGLVPGLSSPTADLSVTAALAIIVFTAVHWFGIRHCGLRAYLKHYISPNPILLPFHLISEITRTLALAIRLFGNIMSLEMAALLLLLVAGFLVPIPLLMLHIIEALVQAYIFGMLALLYIASGLESSPVITHSTPSNPQDTDHV